MDEGSTFFRLKQHLGIQSPKNEEKLANFLMDLINKQFLTFYEEHDFSDELTEEEVMDIITQAEKMGVIQFDFTGGELFTKKRD